MDISLAGIGKVGGALALALARKNFRIKYLVTRNPLAAAKIAAKINPEPQIIDYKDVELIFASDAVFITTRDDEIAATARNFAAQSPTESRTFFFHASGALSSTELAALAAKNFRTASMHPLVAVADAESGAENFAGKYFCLEGNAQAVECGEKIVRALGGSSFTIAAENKSLYHAAAVTCAGHLTALFGAGVEMLAACGVSPENAQEILLPLASSAIENLQNQTPAEALTGPYARGDFDVMRRHLESFESKSLTNVAEIYKILALQSLDMTAQRINSETLKMMREALKNSITQIKR